MAGSLPVIIAFQSSYRSDMAIIFKKSWKAEKGKYAKKYATYRAYPDCFDEDGILQAFRNAIGHFTGEWVRRFLLTAADPQEATEVVIEQGRHETGHVDEGGFCLCFSGRMKKEVAFQIYIVQDFRNKLQIIEITYVDRELKQCFRH